MPEPFRLFAPPPVAAEKLVLVQSDSLYLAIPITQVQEVLQAASVSHDGTHSVTFYRDRPVPVLLGRRPCPPGDNLPLVVLRTDLLSGGFAAIACTALPQLAQCASAEWERTDEILPGLWKADGRAYALRGKLYLRADGLGS